MLYTLIFLVHFAYGGNAISTSPITFQGLKACQQNGEAWKSLYAKENEDISSSIPDYICVPGTALGN